MKVAVLGTGRVGFTLARRWAEKGHDVVLGSRDPDRPQLQQEALQQQLGPRGGRWRAAGQAESVRDAEVVVLAVPWQCARETIQSVGDLHGKVLVDCINPLNEQFNGLDLGFTTSGGEQIDAWAEGAQVVKAFNMVSAASMADPLYGDQPATMFYCGDDPQANAVVHALALDLGFEAVDAGPLSMARYLEPLAMLYIHLAMNQGWGSHCAFKILRR